MSNIDKVQALMADYRRRYKARETREGTIHLFYNEAPDLCELWLQLEGECFADDLVRGRFGLVKHAATREAYVDKIRKDFKDGGIIIHTPSSVCTRNIKF